MTAVAGGTAANPNNSFGSWSITANNNGNLTLAQDLHDVNAGEFEGVGGATGLVLAGVGNIAVGSDGAGDWPFLKSFRRQRDHWLSVPDGRDVGC